MASFADIGRRDDSARALAGLKRDRLRHVRERQRLSRSPPLGIPNPLSEEHEERRYKLELKHRASDSYHQFGHQVEDEEKRIADLCRRLRIADYSTIGVAGGNVRRRWADQGIWNNKWGLIPHGKWKHEEPLELESESETDPEAEPPLYSFFSPSKSKPRRQKSNERKTRIAERRVVRERDREASRPYHQFVYQISKEREQIEHESRLVEGAGVVSANINTRAYESVRDTWTRRGIWDDRWGLLPGMVWKHEEPCAFEEETADSHEVGEAPEAAEAPARTMNSAPRRNLFGPPFTSLSESGVTIKQSPAADIDDLFDPNWQPPAPESPPKRNQKSWLETTICIPSEETWRKIELDFATSSAAKPQGISKTRRAKTKRERPRGE